MEMETRLPARKVTFATLGAAVAQILMWIINLLDPGMKIPEAVSDAFVVVVTFVVGYMTAPAPRDRIVEKRRTTNPSQVRS